MSGNCQNKCIVYRAEVKTSDTKKYYYGVCETTFKKRYSNHLKSFKTAKYKNETALSKYIWQLNEKKNNMKLLGPHMFEPIHINVEVEDAHYVLQKD